MSVTPQKILCIIKYHSRQSRAHLVVSTEWFLNKGCLWYWFHPGPLWVPILLCHSCPTNCYPTSVAYYQLPTSWVRYMAFSQGESHVAQPYWWLLLMETALWWPPRATVSVALLVTITGTTKGAILPRISLNATPGTTFLWSPRETTVQLVFWEFHSPLSGFFMRGCLDTRL